MIGEGLDLGLRNDEDLMVVVMREGETATETDGEAEAAAEDDLDKVLNSFEKKFAPGNEGNEGSGSDSSGSDDEEDESEEEEDEDEDDEKIDTSEPYSEVAYLAARTEMSRNIRGWRIKNRGKRTNGFLTTPLIIPNNNTTNTTTGGVKQCNAFATTYPNSQGTVALLGLSFQLCTVKNNKPEKTLADTAPVSDIMNSYSSDVLMLHQLAVDCPIKVRNQYLNHSSIITSIVQDFQPLHYLSHSYPLEHPPINLSIPFSSSLFFPTPPILSPLSTIFQAAYSYSGNENDLASTFISYVDVCVGMRPEDRWGKCR